MDTKIIVVEDSRYKRDKIIDYLLSEDNSHKITEAHSFTSAWQKLSKYNYDLIILDMSLPTYDKSEHESGGKFRTFGGKELARKISRRKITTKILFITQYESFSDLDGSQTLASLEAEMMEKYPKQCLGVIFFDTSSAGWKQKLNETVGILHNDKCSDSR